ncbi:hypothetical protein BPT24_170 [Tenacibaculum phage pT24]|uniref:Uncharacterized protein n=1 Tax=Tenacibaculum phage pT24 TaxID=1880590 RepID=A0A1B4XWV2_9CAUD|nr:hypothetical protein HYP10_gp170 [Tenacibaculum phage pT24]BAV39296.1 hypothetical protein BPT24_170 [Tenacibaculum phage pT24]
MKVTVYKGGELHKVNESIENVELLQQKLVKEGWTQNENEFTLGENKMVFESVDEKAPKYDMKEVQSKFGKKLTTLLGDVSYQVGQKKPSTTELYSTKIINSFKEKRNSKNNPRIKKEYTKFIEYLMDLHEEWFGTYLGVRKNVSEGLDVNSLEAGTTLIYENEGITTYFHIKELGNLRAVGNILNENGMTVLKNVEVPYTILEKYSEKYSLTESLDSKYSDTLLPKIKVGNKISLGGGGDNKMKVTNINTMKKRLEGEFIDSNDKVRSNITIPFSYFANPHYNKNYKIVESEDFVDVYFVKENNTLKVGEEVFEFDTMGSINVRGVEMQLTENVEDLLECMNDVFAESFRFGNVESMDDMKLYSRGLNHGLRRDRESIRIIEDNKNATSFLAEWLVLDTRDEVLQFPKILPHLKVIEGMLTKANDKTSLGKMKVLLEEVFLQPIDEQDFMNVVDKYSNLNL